MNTKLTELNEAYTLATDKGLQTEADDIVDGALNMLIELLEHYVED